MFPHMRPVWQGSCENAPRPRYEAQRHKIARSHVPVVWLDLYLVLKFAERAIRFIRLFVVCLPYSVLLMCIINIRFGYVFCYMKRTY